MTPKKRIFNKQTVTQALADHYRVCPVCGEPFQRVGRVATFHHSLHNTSGNRAKYPYFIDSHANGKPVHWHCIGRDNRFVTKDLAAGHYEAFYRAFADYVRDQDAIDWMLYDHIRETWRRVKAGELVGVSVGHHLEAVTTALVALVKNDNPAQALVMLDLKAIWDWLAR